MVTYFARKLSATCSPMIGQFFDTMILALTDIQCIVDIITDQNISL